MADFDYFAAAELFTQNQFAPPSADGEGYRARSAFRRPISYRRFATGAEAIRYAIEQLPSESLAATVLETESDRFDSGAIRGLYDDAAYPLPRHAR